MSTKKLIILTVIIFLAGASAYGVYYYVNRSVASIADDDADVSVTPHNLLDEFTKDEQAANARYLDKIILVEGIITSIKADDKNTTTILLDTGDPLSSISCVMERAEKNKIKTVKENDRVKIKGVCTGILMDVILVNCVIEDN